METESKEAKTKTLLAKFPHTDLTKLLVDTKTPRFTIHRYGKFKNGRFQEVMSESEEYFYGSDPNFEGIVPLNRTREEVLAQKLRRNVSVKTSCIIFNIETFEDKEHVLALIESIGEMYPKEIFDMVYKVTESTHDILPQYDEECDLYEKEIAADKITGSEELKAVLEKYKLKFAVPYYSYFESKNTNSSNISDFLQSAKEMPEEWFGKTCYGEIAFIFQDDGLKDESVSEFVRDLYFFPSCIDYFTNDL